MVTVPEIVEKIVKNSPYLEESLARGIINLSALAREIQPQVKGELYKDVQEGAIVMALKRLSPQIKAKTNLALKHVMREMGDLTVKSNLVEYTYANSHTLTSNIKNLFDEIESKQKSKFLTISQGVHETTIILHNEHSKFLENLFIHEQLLFSLNNLSSITISLPASNIEVPGVYYTILKSLAWENIILIDAVSTSNEITIFFHEADVDRAFSVLKKLGR